MCTRMQDDQPENTATTRPNVCASQNTATANTRDGLACLPNCNCRCHDFSFSSLIPSWLVWYIGQVFISRQLLQVHSAWISWSRCNVQTCRGDFLRTMTILWLLPRGLFWGCMQCPTTFRVNICIGAVRTITWDSPVFVSCREGDVRGVKELFAAGKASIWDATVNGHSLFYVRLGHSNSFAY